MIIVVGAGVAGLTAVEHLAAANLPVTLVTAGELGADAVSAGNTGLAQGGIAAALGPHDSATLHQRDTCFAGAGLVNAAAASVLTSNGVHRVNDLLATGFPADRDANHQLDLGLEAAHSRPRIVHAGEDSSGAALSLFLTQRITRLIENGDVRLIQHATLTSLDVAGHRVQGISYTDAAGQHRLAADAVVLATGGYAGLFATTSSSPAVNGQGLLAAVRAGAVVADLEFVQFHPTVLTANGGLISEAVRGAGAVLRTANGKRFMPAAHPEADLAPRDVVSRASFETMVESSADSVFLDATVIEARQGAGTLAQRFPQLTGALASIGIDWTTSFVPVAPAAHYCMGGVATDVWGRTSISGLFAAGEVAATGVHGANRLASNSLLEGLVFGARVAKAAQAFLDSQCDGLEPSFERFIASAKPVTAHRPRSGGTQEQFRHLQQLTNSHLGIIRTNIGLHHLLAQLDDVEHPLGDVVSLMAAAALARTESRGGHWRADYPTPDPYQAKRSAWRLDTSQHQYENAGYHLKEFQC